MTSKVDRDGPGTRGIGRSVQSAIYRAGLFGHRPAVPVRPRALAAAARSAMSGNAWTYTDGAAGGGTTAAANLAAFDDWALVPRMMRDVRRRELGVQLPGLHLDSPLLLCPVGAMELLHRRADVAVARAAARAGVPLTVSTQASVPMEDVAAALGGAPWLFQLYWSNNDELVASLLRRAERAGAAAVVVTVDTHLLGWRPGDLDAGYLPFARGLGIAQYTSDPVFAGLVAARVANGSEPATSAGPASSARAPAEPRGRTVPTPAAVRSLLSIARRHPGRLRDNLRSPVPRAAVETFLDVFSRSDLTWPDLVRLREHTRLPIIVKGIQHPDDARLAAEAGADALWVSNHGGRQVDGAIASLHALPAVVRAAGSLPVIFDSGVRGGADVVKALALGARAVGIGRPYLYGLAAGGTAGVTAVLDHLLAELDINLALVGAAGVADLGPEVLAARRRVPTTGRRVGSVDGEGQGDLW